MLTINADMKFKSLSPICNTTDPMGERIRAEYDMMQVEFTPEELLHLVTEPAEIFLEEGNITNLINDTRINNVQNVKVDMVNNLMNRLMNIANENISYRDTVYIESVLQKLGIHNTQNFLNEVVKLQHEENQTRQLIELYGSNITELRSIINAGEPAKEAAARAEEPETQAPQQTSIFFNENTQRFESMELTFREGDNIYETEETTVVTPGKEKKAKQEEQKKSPETKAKAAEESAAREPVLHLHSDIFERLDTANIYEELSVMYKSVQGSEEHVRASEMGIAEQSKLGDNIVLNALQNYVREENMPLTYRTYNVYEEGDAGIKIENHGDVVENLVSAVLLNYADKAYQLYSQNLNENRELWYDFSETFNNSAENTFRRMEDIHKSDVNLYRVEQNVLTQSRAAKDHEIQLLSEIVHLAENVDIDEYLSPENIDARTLEYIRKYSENANVSSLMQNINQNTTEEFSSAEITNAENNELSLEQLTELQDIQIKQAAQMINKQTLENLKYINSQQTDIRNHIEGRDTVREVSFREALAALNESSEPAEMTNIVNNTTEESEQTVNVDNSRYINTELTDAEFKEQLDIINKQNMEKMVLLKEQNQILKESIREQMINKGFAKGLTPEKMEEITEAIMEHPAEEVTPPEALTSYRENVYNLMSEETKEIFRLVDEYRENPAKALASQTARRMSPELMSREIEFIEKTVREKEEAEKQAASKVDLSLNERNVIEQNVTRETRRREEEKKLESVDLVHKVSENVTDTEDIIEELRRQRNEIKKVSEVRNETEVNTVNKDFEVLNNTTFTTNEINETNINRYINDGVRNNLDSISEHVYNKIEKRLASERKRRGF